MINSLKQQLGIMEEFNRELALNSNIQNCQQKVNDRINEISTLIIQYLKNFKQVIKLDRLQDTCNKISQVCVQGKNCSLQKYDSLKYNSFKYILLNEASIKLKECCWALEFSQDNSLIFYGCDNLIKVNQFTKGFILNEIQQLDAHTKKVTCLNYLKIQNELVSASLDNQIIIWYRNEQGQWIIKQKLNENFNQLNCIIANQQENLLISGSNDKTINFWERQNQGWIYWQSIFTKFWVDGLSLDGQSSKLIACGYYVPEVLVMANTKQQGWIIIQVIKVQRYGLRLCFINCDMFVFQPNECELEIYEFDVNLDEFKKTNEVKAKTGVSNIIFSPCQFIKSKEILIVKNNSFLNIMGRQENGEFVTQQSIEFQSPNFYLRATDDGQYLVIYDHTSSEIKIRKLKYLK